MVMISSSDLETHKREKSSVPIVSSSGLQTLGHRTSQMLMNVTRNTQKHPHSNKTATSIPPASLKGAKAVRELSKDDVIIAVMGSTGSGKSTFINTVAKSDNACGVGHSLESCTSDIIAVRLSCPDLADSDIVLVDTPGFDHSNKHETEIFKMVADWLKTTYEKDILLSGLLYFHRILNTQMAATAVKHLHAFEELCGKNAFQNVMLVMTRWDEVNEETGNFEEKRMQTQYWNKMIERKSKTGRFLGTRESALQLLRPLIDAPTNRRSLLLQHEMVDMRRKLTETSAGRYVFARAGRVVLRRQEMIQRIRDEMKRPKAEGIFLQHEHTKLSERWLTQKLSMLKLMMTGTVKDNCAEGEGCRQGPLETLDAEVETSGQSSDCKKSQRQNEELRGVNRG